MRIGCHYGQNIHKQYSQYLMQKKYWQMAILFRKKFVASNSASNVDSMRLTMCLCYYCCYCYYYYYYYYYHHHHHHHLLVIQY